VLNVEQIKEAVKQWYGAAFDGLNFKKLERALDYQQKGYLEIGEFCTLMDKAISKGKADPRASMKKKKPESKDLRKPRTGQADEKPMTRDSFVYEQDRIGPKEAIMLIDEMILPTDDVFGRNPRAAIEEIFDKIERWKAQFGDSEEYEDIISKRISMFNRPGPPIKIHTLKTLWQHMTAIVDKDSRKTL
jgi:hypothetical protein